ncbi:MAG: peroxiredoxin-like family protein [Methyloligellaceae bacterium]
MSQITPLFPRQQVPQLSLPTIGGATWTLYEQKPEEFTMFVVYRGLHCPLCAKYLGDLNNKIEKFKERGVDVIIASSDTQERAEQAKAEWGLDKLTVAYGMSMEQGRQWGLYISTSRGKTSTGVMEPDLFLEPGIFLIRPSQELYFATVQTMPFARPSFAEILGALDFVKASNYPGRGEVIDHTKV